MNRSQRIRVVSAITLGLAAIAIAYIAVPIVSSMVLWPELAEDLDPVRIMTVMLTIDANAKLVTRISMVVGAVCFGYVFVSLSAWFIRAAQPED